MKPKAWSHSALSQFNNCPRQYHEVKVLKSVVEPQGEAMVWGNRVHETMEFYLKVDPVVRSEVMIAGGRVDLPPEFEVYRPYLDAILLIPGTMYVEHEMSLDTNLVPCEKFADNVFVRGIVDVLHVDGHIARAMDHKTGKRKQDSKQMKLMALLIFAHFPQVQEIKVGFFWLKTGDKDTEKFTRADIPAIWQEFLPEIAQWKKAFATDTWQPRQSGLCHGWCPVTSCEFWKPKRPLRK